MRNAVVYKKLNLGICGSTQGVRWNLADAVMGITHQQSGFRTVRKHLLMQMLAVTDIDQTSDKCNEDKLCILLHN